ncbi:MAG TPA: subclass B3 metallo-beta-lactamase, partial [Burkholderiales bacterium]|nr:subclass B3 metallo-beta-lactamase [Burkholderiales bacterium]
NNLYYVGTYDLAVYLIRTKDGSILINTGVNDSTPAIRANIEALGFKFSDIKVLLATHGHWDHVAAMAEIKRLTGATMMMHEDDAELLETGGGYDFRFPKGRGAIYEPIKVDRRLKDGEKVRLGEVELTLHHHPGHTKGASSFTYTTQEGGRKYNVLIVNMGSINPGVNVGFMPAFPKIADAYSTTLAKQKQMKPDIWVSSHAGHFDMHDKYKPGDKYDPNRFVDPKGYLAKIELYEKRYQDQLQKDREAAKAQ